MSDEEIRRLEREWRANPCSPVCDALGRARARTMVGITPAEEAGVYRHRSGMQLVHVPDLALFVGRFPVTIGERSELYKNEPARSEGRVWDRTYAVKPWWALVHVPCILSHEDAADALRILGARFLTAEEWKYVALGRPTACPNPRTKIAMRMFPWGHEPPDAMKAVWLEHPLFYEMTMDEHDYRRGVNARALPVLVENLLVSGPRSRVVARPSGVSWCGALDLWHVRERVLLDGWREFVPEFSGATTSRLRFQPGGMPGVVGGSFRTSEWSAEPWLREGRGMGETPDESDVGFRACFPCGGA